VNRAKKDAKNLKLDVEHIKKHKKISNKLNTTPNICVDRRWGHKSRNGKRKLKILEKYP
jgi:hypothetical protein